MKLTVAENLEGMMNSQHNYDLLTTSIIDCRRMPEFADKLKRLLTKTFEYERQPMGYKKSFS